jgi:poly(A) polymerase/tRNA nucleotidyltransferase (CCA-adding enzyme)
MALNKYEIKKLDLPLEVINVIQTLKDKACPPSVGGRRGFEAYLIGGCVRDLLLNRKPKDWDVTTDATPEEIIALFKDTFYENNYGTVGIVNEESKDETLKVIEVTPYRLEAEYSDNRRPDHVTFSKNLEDDLQRRDFTINAIALDIKEIAKNKSVKGGPKFSGEYLDYYNGHEDLQAKIIRTVGEAHDRFTEDGLRILRAVRIATEIGFCIDKKTEKAIVTNASLLTNIAKERIRDEFTKIIMSDNPMAGLVLCRKMGLIPYIIPKIESTVSVEQSRSHIYDVFEHSLRSLQHTADKKYPLEIRLAALFHDIGKPPTRRRDKEQDIWTFYGHEVTGAKIVAEILADLRFPKKIIEKVTKLVRWHMFFADTEQISLSAVRRIISSVGRDNIWDLMNLRGADRMGMGRPKESPYRLRKYHSMVEEAMTDPVSVGMLEIDGAQVMKFTGEAPGPKIGYMLHALLEEMLENPALNTEEYLKKRAKELAKLDANDLKKLGDSGKETKEKEEEKKIEEIRKKHWVQ